MHPLENLLYYPAFRGGLRFAAALCVVLVGWIVLITVIHTAATLGRRTIMYGKQPPRREWSKHFYPAAVCMIGLLLALAFWLRHITQM